MKGLMKVEKIKINLQSGTSIEKPLITAFKGSNGEYVVLDNEIKGSMGLPIILVSKLENNALVKIEDKSAEWEAVKESLRLIIAGNQIDYISVLPEINAADVFFTQLTLPVASFDALKNNYNTLSEGEPVASSEEPKVTPEVVNEVATEPAISPETVITAETQVAEESNDGPATVEPTTIETSIDNQEVKVEKPVVEEAPVVDTPVIPDAPIESQTVAEVQVSEAPQTDNVPVDFTADKEAFLKACENMFDALVSKIQSK